MKAVVTYLCAFFLIDPSDFILEGFTPRRVTLQVLIEAFINFHQMHSLIVHPHLR